MNWLCKHFSPEEFGPRPDRVAAELFVLMDKIRAAAGCGIVIHCSWSESGHAERSYHYTGQACDFHFRGLSYLTQYALLREFREIGGLGFYPEWSAVGWHVDLRSGFLQWVCRNNVYQYGWKTMAKELNA